jgi:hypothetical protein
MRTVILGCAAMLALCTLAAPGPAVEAAVPEATGAVAAATPWPSAPDWQGYVEAPSGSAVCPVAVEATPGTVTGARNLACGGPGGATLTLAPGGATLTLAPGGATPAIVLGYGQETCGPVSTGRFPSPPALATRKPSARTPAAMNWTPGSLPATPPTPRRCWRPCRAT